MFTVSEGSELSADLIKEAIEYNETLREHYDVMEDYYRGNHPVKYRKKPNYTKNNRIIINHAKYITDINVGYLLGNPVDYKVNEGKEMGQVLEQYTEQVIADIDSEIAKDVSIFGRQYELVYADENNVRSADIDVRNAICVYDDTVAHRKLFGIVYKIADIKGTKKKDTYEYITVYDNENKYDCVSAGKIIIPDGEPHTFGKIPLIEYKNNSEVMGDFEQVISLIDAYNILQSDRVNDKEQLVEAILVGYGIDLEEGQMDKMLVNKTVFGLPPRGEADLEYLVKNLDESQVDILRSNIEQDIHKISQTPNMSDENFAGNNSGVAIRYKLLAFEQSVQNKERFFVRGLLERFELYKNYLESVSKPVSAEKGDVIPVLKRNLPQNDLEIAQMVSLLAHLVDDETLVGQLSFVEDASKSIELNREEELLKFGREISQFGTPRPTGSEDNLSEEE